MESGSVDDLEDLVRLLVAEHDDRVNLAGQALDDVAHHLDVHLPGTGGEHESERVGVERGREERIVLVRYPADLYEHNTGRSLGVDESPVVEVIVGLEIEEPVPDEQPTDTAENVNYETVAEAAKVAFALASELAAS